METEISTNGFPQLAVTRKTGDEPFHLNGTPLDSLLVDFWRWSMSDLVSNTARGVLAEYIVAQALGLTNRLRIEWDAYDLQMPSGIRIEVKAAAYLQSWQHNKLSAINFNIRPARGWDAATNVRATEPRRQADIYVFCVLKHQDKATVDPLNLAQWDFYVLRAAVLNEQLWGQKKLSLGRLLKLKPLQVTYEELAASIEGSLRKSVQSLSGWRSWGTIGYPNTLSPRRPPRMSSIPADLECIQAGDPHAMTHGLNLPDLHVTQMTFLRTLGWLLIYAHSPAPTACCPRCGHPSAQVHQYHVRLVRDLAWADLRSVLHLVRRRFKCGPCARPFTEPLSAVAPHARTTTRYATHLVAAVRETSIAATAARERHGYKAVEGIVYRQAAATYPSAPPQRLIKRLGIDEIAARKGHGHYQLVLVDLDTHQVIEQLPDRDKATVRAYFAQWTAAARAAVEEVATDFWAAYHEVAAELFPQARVVGDRFHVQQHVNDALNTVRREVQRQMIAEDRAWLQARRHLFLRNDEDLEAAEQVDLEIAKAYVPALDVAHTLKERLRTIYTTAPDRASAATQLTAWLDAMAASGVAALVKVGEFVGRWQEPILNYFVRRTTSGAVEGLNNKIKLVKRRAFGFGNDAHFRLRVLLACNGAP